MALVGIAINFQANPTLIRFGAALLPLSGLRGVSDSGPCGKKKTNAKIDNYIKIHHNPVSKKWSLAKDYADYERSSASFYEKGIAKNFLHIHCEDVW